MKKVLSILSIIAGSLLVLSGVAPVILSVILKVMVSSSVGVIGGADGPTAIFVTGSLGAGYVTLVGELLLGIVLIGIGIWGCKKSRR